MGRLGECAVSSTAQSIDMKATLMLIMFWLDGSASPSPPVAFLGLAQFCAPPVPLCDLVNAAQEQEVRLATGSKASGSPLGTHKRNEHVDFVIQRFSHVSRSYCLRGL